jgi:hypothetical protein
MQLTRPFRPSPTATATASRSPRRLPRAAEPGSARRDGDGFGDACDGDFDQDGVVGPSDSARFERAASARRGCLGSDLDGDGVVDERDARYCRLARPPAGPAARRSALLHGKP